LQVKEGEGFMRILTTTPILTGEITINEFLGCEWIREARDEALTNVKAPIKTDVKE
jgi:hypothetical protein